ncbi:MAG: hypothetical protein R3Y07_05195 [Eubacteriales bacterium]
MSTTEELIGDVQTMVLAMGKGEGEETLLLALVTSAVEEFLSRIKSTLTVDECKQQFLLACAWVVIDGLSAVGGSVSASSFRVGEFSMTQSEGEGTSSGLRDRAEELMRPYLKGSSFGFYAMEG